MPARLPLRGDTAQDRDRQDPALQAPRVTRLRARPRLNLAWRRLVNQRLVGPPLATPTDVIRHLGAVQAQDYGGAKWAVAQRSAPVTDAELDRLLAEGTVLRTHVMRPTWHFVLPEDIRWLLALTAPRVHAASALVYRREGLDEAVFARSHRVLEKALRDHAYKTRTELGEALAAAGIPADRFRLSYLMMQAELAGVICSGPRRGKQFTYAVLAERAPAGRVLELVEALVELATRYFNSHGPALLTDFTWWSGLTMADARRALALAGYPLVQEGDLWSAPGGDLAPATPSAHLLANFDEFMVAYRGQTLPLGLGHILVVDGQVAGGWRRTMTRGDVRVEVKPISPLPGRAAKLVAAEIERYRRFMGMAG
ncbi:MAG: winged helix DNA-binding domain-containing protein [Chloroflexota bacterium]